MVACYLGRLSSMVIQYDCLIIRKKFVQLVVLPINNDL